jgi:phage terminase large subunit-like protein
MAAGTVKAPKKAAPKSAVPKEWRDLLRLIPGYDPIKAAGDAWFDPATAQLYIDFIQDCIHHVEGDKAGQLFVLEPWQQAVVANLFGWLRKDDEGRAVRRYREALLYVPRKNGKTPLAAAIALAVFTLDPEAGQQNYVAADSRGQAGKLFRQLKGMVGLEPEMKKLYRDYGGTAQAGQAKSIVKKNEETSFIQVISADANSEHGGNTHLAMVDELHTQPNRELIDVLTTSTASQNRKQPLAFYMTTADFDRPSICNEKHAYACQVRDGVIDDPAFFPIVYEASPDDDWKSERTWKKANPNLGVSVSVEYLRRQCKIAQETPAYENTFKRLHLNLKTEQADRVIPVEQWDACKVAADLAALGGRVCYAGLDIGATSDFTAFTLLFPHEDAEAVPVEDPERPDAPPRMLTRRSYTLFSWFWLPETPARRDPRMADVIDGWRRQGHIRTTPGNSVDYDLVLEDIVEPFTLARLAFDRGFQGGQTGTNLMKHYGDKVVYFPQGILSMSGPFREFLELISLKRFHHDGHPVMRWMVSNVAAERRGGLMKPSKDKSAEKIDGVTGAVMALGVAIQGDPGIGNWFEPGMWSK